MADVTASVKRNWIVINQYYASTFNHHKMLHAHVKRCSIYFFDLKGLLNILFDIFKEDRLIRNHSLMSLKLKKETINMLLGLIDIRDIV